MSEQIFLQTLVNGIMGGLVLIMIALGLTLVFGVLHIINMAHGELYMLGGFGIWLLFAQSQVNFFLAALATTVAVVALGVLIERFLLKRFRGNLLGGMIISMGLTLILQTTALLTFGGRDKGVPTLVTGKIEIFGVSFSWERLMVVMICAVLITLLYAFVRYTNLGRAMRAVAEDQDAAALQGINIDKTCSLAMGIGTALAALAGILIAPIFYVNPFIGASPLMKGLVVIVLGGLGSIPGTLLGGLIIGVVESFSSTLFNNAIAMALIFLVLPIVLIFRPAGLLGHEE
jgi:branched-chain amino acid transport system permease protein